MNKSIMKKAILIVVLITLLFIVSVGCTSIFSTTGTVNISVVSGIVMGKLMINSFTYDINMDGIYVGTTDASGNLTIPDVPVGWHNFEAFSTFGSGYGSKGQNINSGINNVTITVPPFII
jgi:uncharacterized membrane protein